MKGLLGRSERSEQHSGFVLHTDQDSVYASKDFDETLPLYNIVYSMSRVGTPTDNGAMEAINCWTKSEIFTEFYIAGDRAIQEEIKAYFRSCKEERPVCPLNCLTPNQNQASASQNI